MKSPQSSPLLPSGFPAWNSLPERFGFHLHTARLDRGLSIAALARLAEISPASISEYENGRGKMPGWPTLTRLCEVLDVDVSELFRSGL